MHGSISAQRMAAAGPPSGITPRRAPYEGSHRNGKPVPSPVTAAMAACMSNTTGRSQKTTSRSVMAKSWTIVGPLTSTGSLCTREPSAAATW